MVAQYCIGSTHWNGLSKVVEEAGELLQVCGKLMANEGEELYWGNVNLRDKFVEEIGDMYAALDFFIEQNDFDKLAIADQFVKKLNKYRKWNSNPEIYAGYSKAIDKS